jgi:acyl dehydratase
LRLPGDLPRENLEPFRNAPMNLQNRDAASLSLIENRTFEELAVGDTASSRRVLTRREIELFAIVSGDVNPAHLDPAFAETDLFHTIVAHGMWGGALVSAVLGTQLPGPGTIYLGQDLSFRRPVRLGDTVTATVTVREKRAGKNVVVFDCQCLNQFGEEVIHGRAEVIAPTEKVARPRTILPSG